MAGIETDMPGDSEAVHRVAGEFRTLDSTMVEAGRATREKIGGAIDDGWDATGGKVVEGVQDTWDELFG